MSSRVCGDLITRAKHTQQLVPSKVVIQDLDMAASFQHTFLTAYLCITLCSRLACANPHQFIIALPSLLSPRNTPWFYSPAVLSPFEFFFHMFSACSVNSNCPFSTTQFHSVQAGATMTMLVFWFL